MPLFSPTAFFPDNINVDKAKLREACTTILAALGELTASHTAETPGELVVLGSGTGGPAPASLGSVPITCSGRAVSYVRTQDLTLGSNLNLTDFAHLGRWLKKTDSSSCLITVEPHADPTIGVLQGFKCVIKRRAGAGSVQVTSSMANTHLSGHTRVASNGIATLEVDTVQGEWSLHGETLA